MGQTAIAVVFVIAVAIVGFLLLSRTVEVPPLQETAEVTTLTLLSGTARIHRGEPPQPIDAEDGMALQVRDTIRTDSASYAVITFVDGTTMTLEPSTGVTIASLLEGRASQPLATAIALQQESGVTWSNVPSLVASSLFQIETAAAVVLVRGTSIKVTVERQSNRAQVEVYSGVAQVRARGEEVQLTPGTQSLIPVGAGPGEQLNIDAPSERLRFTMSPAIWAYATNPIGLSAGFLAPGMEVNQALGGDVGLPFGGTRYFELPVTEGGEYPVLIQGGLAGEYQLVVQGLSGESPVFVDGVQGTIEPGQQFLGYLTVKYTDGKLTGGNLNPFTPHTGGTGPGKIVRTRRAISGVAVTATSIAAVGQATPISTLTPTRTPTFTVTPAPTETVTQTPTVTPTGSPGASRLAHGHRHTPSRSRSLRLARGHRHTPSRSRSARHARGHRHTPSRSRSLRHALERAHGHKCFLALTRHNGYTSRDASTYTYGHLHPHPTRHPNGGSDCSTGRHRYAGAAAVSQPDLDSVKRSMLAYCIRSW